MTQEHKSAADVAAREITSIIRSCEAHHIGSKGIELIIERAIQSETKALAAENLELRAEIGRLRVGLECYAENGPFQFEPADADEWLSQPTPTGSGERFLRLAAAANQYIETQAHVISQMAIREAYEALTPEDMKILENYHAPEP